MVMYNAIKYRIITDNKPYSCDLFAGSPVSIRSVSFLLICAQDISKHIVEFNCETFNMSRTTRKQINIEEKSRIISKLESGVPNKVLAKEYGISRSTISTIWKERKKIQSIYDKNFLKMKRVRITKHTKIEDALLKWFKYRRTNNVPTNGPILQQKANDFAQRFGEDFVCSSSWIQRFRARHGIVGGKRSGEAASADKGSMKPITKSSDIRKECLNVHLIDAELNKMGIAEPIQSYEKTEDFEKQLILDEMVKKEVENGESDDAMTSDVITDDIDNCVREKTNDCGSTKTRRKNYDIKQEYFKAKLRNAKLENKYLINKNKMEINKYKMEMEILKLRLKKLKSTH